MKQALLVLLLTQVNAISQFSFYPQFPWLENQDQESPTLTLFESSHFPPSSLSKHSSNHRNLQNIQNSLLIELKQTRTKKQQNKNLTPQQLQNLYNIQEKRDNTQIKNHLKKEKNQQKQRRDMRNTDKQNNSNRTIQVLQEREAQQMKRHKKQEVSRKYER